MAESFSVKAILSAKDSNFSSTMKACSGYAENLKSTLTSGIGFGAMAAIGSKAVSVVGNGLKSLTTGAISAGTNFESAMSSVASISGATGNDLKELTSKAEQMGATTQFSATEAANAMEYMAMAGWKTKDMVSGIGGIMNLAAASGADLARTSDIVTDALTAFGKSASDSGTFADVMAAASSNANTNVEMMGETFKYVGAAAGAMGYSIQDIALATGLMANSGIKGSEAGTALRSVITRMAKPTKESSAAMKKLGLSMTDSKGRMKSFGTIMKDMRKGMKGMTEDQKASYAAMLGGQEAMSGVLAIANASEKDFNKLSKAIDNSKNAAQNMAKVKLDNLKGDVTILQSSMEGLGITIFDQVGGNLRGLVGTATDVVGKINEKLSNGKGIENFIYKMQLLQRKATPYWNALKINGIEAGKALGDAISAIITDISKLTGSFGSTDSIRNFSDMIGTAKDGIVTFSGFLENHSDTVAKVIVLLPKLLLAYKGFKVVGAIAPFMGIFASGILRLGKAGLSKIAPNLFKVAKGQEAAGKASSGSAKKMVASAKAFALMGVGVLTIGAGFYLLAQSAVAVANAGPGAVAVLAVLVGVVTGLTVGMTKMLSTMSGGTKKLSAMTPALLALGASILLASAGMAVLAYSAVQIAQAGPGAAAVLLGMVVALGALLLVAKSVAPAMTAGAAGFVAFGAAVLLAGAGIAVLSLAAISLANAGPVAIGVMVGMVAAVALLAAGAAVLGPALTVGAVGFIAFGAAIVLVATGALIASAALAIVAAVLPTVSQYGAQGAVAIAQLGAGLLAFGAGAAAAGIGAVVLGAGLTIVAAGLVVGYQLIAQSNKAFREAYNKLNALLDTEQAKMIFLDEPDKYFIGTKTGMGEVPVGRNAITAEIEFYCADPFKYSVKEYEVDTQADNASIFIVDYAGTHRAYPVLEATIKSDNGLVGFVKENKSLLQFGNPDETDQESYKQVELVTNCSSYATWSGDEKWKTDTGGNFLYRDSKTAGTMAVNDLGLNNGTKGLFLTASGNTAGENTKWWNGAMKAIAIVDSNGEKGSTKTYSYVNSWFETGVMGQTGCQAIAFCDENGKMICCQEIYKNDMSGNTAHMAMWVGGNNPRIVKDYSFEPVYWDSNPFNRNQGHSDMMKWDDTIRFHWCGSYPEYKVPELKNTKVHSVKLYIGQYGNRNMSNQYVWRNVFRGISVRISDITKWRDAPNKFTTNEIFRVDCGSGNVTLQGLARPDLGALGNDWEGTGRKGENSDKRCISRPRIRNPINKRYERLLYRKTSKRARPGRSPQRRSHRRAETADA